MDGFRLASFFSQENVMEEIPELKLWLLTRSYFQLSQVWIGMNDESIPGTYQWSDGSTVNATYWSEGEPNGKHGDEHCVVMYSHGRWNDENCQTVLWGLCAKDREWPEHPPEPERVTLSSPVLADGKLGSPAEPASEDTGTDSMRSGQDWLGAPASLLLSLQAGLLYLHQYFNKVLTNDAVGWLLLVLFGCCLVHLMWFTYMDG